MVCLDINAVGNSKTVETIKSSGWIAFGFTCDVTNKEEVDTVFRQIDDTVGDVTMLFHCCGVPSPRSLINDPPSIRSTLDVSIVSHFHVSQFFTYKYFVFFYLINHDLKI